MAGVEPEEQETRAPRVLPGFEARLSRWIIAIGFLGIAISGVGGLIHAIIVLARSGELAQIVQAHIPAIVGTPMAIMAAFVIVQLLRGIHGPIELEVKFLKFRGATGPAILWLLCFIGIVIAIRLLWPL